MRRIPCLFAPALGIAGETVGMLIVLSLVASSQPRFCRTVWRRYATRWAREMASWPASRRPRCLSPMPVVPDLRHLDDRRRVETFDDEPEAQRELPGGDREARDPRPHRDRLVDAEQRAEDGRDEQGGTEEAQRGDGPRHEAGTVQHGTQ